MVERQTAVKVSVRDLLDGEYVEREGWNPNFVRTPRGPVSRASLMGVITQESEPGVYVFDDGSGTVRLRTFDGPADLRIGVPVHVIGRPRKYSQELFMNYEIVKEISKGWLEYRRAELARIPREEVKGSSSEGSEAVVVAAPRENLFSKVVDVIKELDDGSGADIEAVVSKVDHKEAEHVLQSLLEEGEVFELKPGMVKVLE